MNVQNIPRDDKVVKRAFRPKLDALFFCDYPNIELKMLAFYLEKLGFPEMAEYFRTDPDPDLHKKTASGMYHVSMEEVEDWMRQIGKRLNFSIVYGGGAPTLMKQGAASTFEGADEILGQFHGAWPGIGWERRRNVNGERKLIEADPGTLYWHVKNEITSKGYIYDLWGRHLHPRSLHSAINALLQGGAADLKKWAMIQLHDWLKQEGLVSHMVNEVHDDIIFDATHEELPVLAERVPELMVYPELAESVPHRPEPEVSYTTWADREAYAPGQ